MSQEQTEKEASNLQKTLKKIKKAEKAGDVDAALAATEQALKSPLLSEEDKAGIKEIMLQPEPAGEENVPEYDVRGNMDYWINYKGANFTARYNFTTKEQLIGMMMVRDTFVSVLDKDHARPKEHPHRMKWQEKQRLSGAVHQLNKYIAELAGYVLSKHKQDTAGDSKIHKIGLTDQHGNPLK